MTPRFVAWNIAIVMMAWGMSCNESRWPSYALKCLGFGFLAIVLWRWK